MEASKTPRSLNLCKAKANMDFCWAFFKGLIFRFQCVMDKALLENKNLLGRLP